MSRTGEKVLSIISIVMNVLSLGLLIVFVIIGGFLKNDPQFQQEIENEYINSGLSQAEIDAMNNTIFTIISSIGWLLVIIVVVAIVLTIIGVVKVKNHAKTAGILFLIASFLSGIMSIPGILLIIAGVMCFVRKEEQPPIDNLSGDIVE